MRTLYDLLGALAGDDADDLRKAFRNAVKGTHPDIRPNDPQAALNFRLIIHAMEVLGDPDQRAAYDHLLDQARRELEQERRAARIRNVAFAMIALAGLAVVAASVRIVLAPMAAVPPQARQTDEPSRGPAEIASNSPAARPGEHDNSAGRGAEAPKPAETQDDFLKRWGASDFNAPADRKAEAAKPAEEQHQLTPPPDTNENNAPADRKVEAAKPAEEQHQLAPPPDANENNAPADRKVEAAKPAEEQHQLTPPPDANQNNAPADRKVETAKPAAEQHQLTPPPDTNQNNAPADRKVEAAKPAEEQHQLTPPPDANENNAPADRKVEAAKPVEEQHQLTPPPDTNENKPPKDRNAETAPVAKEPETPAIHAPGLNPPARHDDADGINAAVEPDDKTDPSAMMHAQGVAAYRNGDLKLALANFDRAIALNPTFMIAYINRGIVLYRMGKLDRALADVARARQIDRAGRASSAKALRRRRHRDVSLIESSAWLQAAGL